jgi:hypothetical protein
MMQAFYTSGYLYELLRSKTLHDDPDEVDDTVLV